VCICQLKKRRRKKKGLKNSQARPSLSEDESHQRRLENAHKPSKHYESQHGLTVLGPSQSFSKCNTQASSLNIIMYGHRTLRSWVLPVAEQIDMTIQWSSSGATNSRWFLFSWSQWHYARHQIPLAGCKQECDVHISFYKTFHHSLCLTVFTIIIYFIYKLYIIMCIEQHVSIVNYKFREGQKHPFSLHLWALSVSTMAACHMAGI
jgi:hypothetical protein